MTCPRILTAAMLAASLVPVSARAAEVVVRFAPGADRAAALAGTGADVTPVALPRTVVVDVPGDTRRAVDALNARDDVVVAEPTSVYRSDRVPNDPLFVRQWGLSNPGGTVGSVTAVPGTDVNAPAAWDVTTGDASVVVGVVDSGIARDNPDLAPNVSATDPGTDIVDGDGDPDDLEGHGTLVAGIIAARGDDGYGTAGVSWNSRLVSLRALDETGSGRSVDVAQAFAEAGTRRLRIVNASLGSSVFSRIISDAVSGAPDTLFVVAAGNDGQNGDVQPHYPCALPQANIVCVASLDASGALAASSNYGAQSVDLAAPGVDIVGPSPAFGDVAFKDDFETAPEGRWVSGGGTTWGQGTLAGSATLSDSPATATSSRFGQTVRMASPVSLAGRHGCRLSMDMRVAGDAGVTVRVQASTNGGVSWNRQILRVTGGDDATATPWDESIAYLDGQPSVMLRFVLDVASGSGGDGVDVDDLVIGCRGGTYSGAEAATGSGTSFSAPHVTGIAALVAARHPEFTAAQLKQALLQGTVPVASLAGKTVTGGRADAAAALAAADRIAVAAAAASRTTTPAPTGSIAANSAGPALQARLGAPYRVGRARWVALNLSQTARVRVVLARRVTRSGLTRFVTARAQPLRRMAAGTRRIALGRLGAGTYRVTVTLPDAHWVLTRTFRVTR